LGKDKVPPNLYPDESQQVKVIIAPR
jgi:hypothetical protein